MTEYDRKSIMEIGEIYFWTCTILHWQKLLFDESYKEVVIQSLQYLKSKNKITIYSYVIMPNHIHMIWRLNEMNGKEMPNASFTKHTAHVFKNKLKLEKPDELRKYSVNEYDRKYRIWQRDSLAILLDTRKKAEQKLDYIHFNPMQERWKLVNVPEEYAWSSATYYETGIDKFNLLSHYMEEYI